MKKIFLAASLVLLAAAFTNCKKTQPKPAAIDITGTYKLIALEEKNSIGTFDLFAELETCMTDDLLQFKADNTYTYTDAGETCDPKGDETGSWQFKGTDSVVIDGTAAALVSYSNQQLVLRRNETIMGQVSVVTATYAKQ